MRPPFLQERSLKNARVCLCALWLFTKFFRPSVLLGLLRFNDKFSTRTRMHTLFFFMPLQSNTLRQVIPTCSKTSFFPMVTSRWLRLCIPHVRLSCFYDPRIDSSLLLRPFMHKMDTTLPCPSCSFFARAFCRNLWVVSRTVSCFVFTRGLGKGQE